MKHISRNKDTGTALERYRKSFWHAIDGIVYAFFEEHNMIIIFLAGVLAVLFAFMLDVSVYEWLFIIIIIGLVAMCEMINTAIEATVDLITVKEHPLAKVAKDAASGASLILVIVSIIGGIIIFVPKIVALIG